MRKWSIYFQTISYMTVLVSLFGKKIILNYLLLLNYNYISIIKLIKLLNIIIINLNYFRRKFTKQFILHLIYSSCCTWLIHWFMYNVLVLF